MPVVHVSKEIRANIDDVWNTVSDIFSYPDIMTPVKQVKLVEQTGSEIISDWTVDLEGSTLCWRQIEHQDRNKRKVTYRQIEGDLETFFGSWELMEVDQSITLAVFQVNFEIGIPVLENMLNPAAKRALKANAILMLDSLDQAAS